MKAWIFKGLAYLATCGAAATTVLLTASSVGLKKSVTETFPNLSGLIQNRPDVKEDLLEPVIPPPPPDPAKAGNGDTQQKTDANADQAGDKGNTGDDQANQNGDANPNSGGQGADAAGQAGAGGAHGGVAGGSAGGVACETGAEGLKKVADALGTALRSYTGMDTQIQGAATCLTQIFSTPQGTVPAGPGSADVQLPAGPNPPS